MKRIVFFIFIIIYLLPCSLTITKAQTNLVMNPSLEDTLFCPQGPANIWQTKHWTSPLPQINTTTELFHRCSNYWNVINLQEPRTGDAIGGFCLFVGGFWREYAEVELIEPLMNGREYCVTFYVSLANFAATAIDAIQAYFSSNYLQSSTSTRILVKPQIINNGGIITDTINWIQISGSFIAKGGEKYMTIGNFESWDSTHYISYLLPDTHIGAAYYFFDDF